MSTYNFNTVVDTYSDDMGTVLCYVDLSTPYPNRSCLLVKQTSDGPRIIGTTTKKMIETENAPIYDDNMQKTEHILLQKTVDREGNRSLVYMLPLESDKNQLVGGFLFCRKRIANTCQTQFLGSVSVSRFNELKKNAIPLDLSPEYPFLPEHTVQPILPDTRIPLVFDHYRKQKHRLSKAVLFMIRSRNKVNHRHQ